MQIDVCVESKFVDDSFSHKIFVDFFLQLSVY